MSSYRIRIDIDNLGDALKKDPSLISKVTFKDGTEHRMVSVNIMERRQPSDKGATHYMKIDLYHRQELQGVNYYLGDCYPINFGARPQQEQQRQPPAQQPSPAPQRQADAKENGSTNDLPF